MGRGRNHKEQRYLRSDHSLDQRTFDADGIEVGIDDQTHDEVWTDVLSLGQQFNRNIADTRLGIAMQPRRGEILVIRSERSQDTRAIPFRDRKHERPALSLTHQETREHLPRENEQRSLTTALHGRHTRGYTPIPEGEKPGANRKLALGGFMTNIGEVYRRLAAEEERTRNRQQREAAKRKSHQPTDDVTF